MFLEVFADEFLFTRVGGQPLFGRLVSGSYFNMLGVDAAMGRTLLPEDATIPRARAVLVLNYVTWKNKFGADPNILGRKLLVHGHPFEVIGIIRREFGGLDNVPLDFWAPLTMSSQLVEGPDLFGLEIREKLLGPNHPHVAVIRHNLAELERACSGQPAVLALNR